MRYLLGHSHYPYEFSISDWVGEWCTRLRKGGIEVYPTCLTINPPAHCLTWPELDRKYKEGDKDLFALYERIAREVEDYDVFINWNGINLHPDFVRQLRCCTVFSCFDDPENSENLSKPAAAAYDICMVGNIAELDTYRSWGVSDPHFWPHGFRVSDYNPELTKEMVLSGERPIDITLQCDRTAPWRKAKMDILANTFPDGAFYGKGWEKGFLPEAERIGLLQKSKLGINVHNSTGPINFRTYYLPANGVLQVCDNKSHLGQIFELGKEVAGFDSIEEGIDLCRYYLAHDDERRKVAAAGFERATRDYNEVAAFKYLTRAVEKHFKLDTYDLRPITVSTFTRPQRKTFLHLDDIYSPDQWWMRFDEVLKKKYNVEAIKVNIVKSGIASLVPQVGENDILIGRFGHETNDLATMRPRYRQLRALFGERIFPNLQEYFFMDDKAKQFSLFQSKGYSIPHTTIFESVQQLQNFMGLHDLKWPLVVKGRAGAGSTQVRLSSSADDIRAGELVQEFCPDNPRDYRINVIGHRVMGYVRRNRDNDFRASGSGRRVYPYDFDPELVEMAYKMSQENGFTSMAYDFVRRNNKWVCLEFCYGFVDTFITECPYYYDMKTGNRVDKRGIYPEDFILEDIMQRWS